MNWEFAKTKTIKAAKNLNATNIFSTKQQISHALSQNVITSFLLEFSLVQGEKIQTQQKRMSPGQLIARHVSPVLSS